MQDKTLNPVDAHPQRRPAVWPWLLIPLVTLLLFYALTQVREAAVKRAGSVHTTAVHPAQDSSPR